MAGSACPMSTRSSHHLLRCSTPADASRWARRFASRYRRITLSIGSRRGGSARSSLRSSPSSPARQKEPSRALTTQMESVGSSQPRLARGGARDASSSWPTPFLSMIPPTLPSHAACRHHLRSSRLPMRLHQPPHHMGRLPNRHQSPRRPLRETARLRSLPPEVRPLTLCRLRVPHPHPPPPPLPPPSPLLPPTPPPTPQSPREPPRWRALRVMVCRLRRRRRVRCRRRLASRTHPPRRPPPPTSPPLSL